VYRSKPGTGSFEFSGQTWDRVGERDDLIVDRAGSGTQAILVEKWPLKRRVERPAFLALFAQLKVPKSVLETVAARTAGSLLRSGGCVLRRLGLALLLQPVLGLGIGEQHQQFMSLGIGEQCQQLMKLGRRRHPLVRPALRCRNGPRHQGGREEDHRNAAPQHSRHP